jgi:hypothetical protein
MELSLAFIGWFFTLTSAGALLLGAALIWMIATAGDLHRRYLSYSIWNDLVLAAIWALIVLLLLSAASRLYALRQPDQETQRLNWLGAIGGITLILIPVLAICAATIVTLRSPEAMKAFS